MDHLSLDVEEARVLGVLVEKGATTPDQYPMTLNGVRLGCNQASNRDPVVDFDEATVERALRRLADRALVKMVHRPGDRVVKYRHALGEALELGDESVAVLAVLLLRGTQTAGELRQRTARHVAFSALSDVERVLDDLASHDPPLVERLGRRPGQKEVRYRPLVAASSEPREAAAPSGDTAVIEMSPPGRVDTAASDELAGLAAEVADLRRRFEELLAALGVDDV